MLDGVPVAVAGGVESISLVQGNLNKHHFTEEWLMRHKPEIMKHSPCKSSTVGTGWEYPWNG
jgi:acetyl-CoA C-acetyltransferase